MHRLRNVRIMTENDKINTLTNKAVSDTQMITPSVYMLIPRTTNGRAPRRPSSTHLHTVQIHGRIPLKINATALLLLSLEMANPQLDNQDGMITATRTNTLTLPPPTLSGRPKPFLPDPGHIQMLPPILIRHLFLPPTLRPLLSRLRFSTEWRTILLQFECIPKFHT